MERILEKATNLADDATGAAGYPLLDALRQRRSRRFGLGMAIDSGPFTYTSQHLPQPLTEEEEALLAFAACGVTGNALADLAYGSGQGGAMLMGLVGRTISSADAVHSVSLVITNDAGSWWLRRPQDFSPAELAELIELAQRGDLVEWYRRSRVQIGEGRAAPPVAPGYNFNINKWSLYAAGGTYFLPINELTALYINALLEAFDPTMGLFILDERANFRPAGIGRFARSKGGHLQDDLSAGRAGTVQALELAVLEGVAIEQGMMIQNIGLMAQALGLGGFANFAPHPASWFEALGFRMGSMPASRYLGANRLITAALAVLGRDRPFAYPLGLERDGHALLQPFCPPAYPSMEAAVHAVVEAKFGSQGIFRGGAARSAWRDPAATGAGIPAPSQEAIAATVAYCAYIHRRYGRFPAYAAPFRTVMGYQATHVDPDFYARFYKPEALSESQRSHQARWHGHQPATSPVTQQHQRIHEASHEIDDL